MNFAALSGMFLSRTLLLGTLLAWGTACAQSPTASTASSSPATTPPWPDGAKVAVSLSYDDTLNSQLDHAIPALERQGLRGSFYLILTSDVLASRMGEWRAAAQRGHELGNHSVYHACSKSQPGTDWVADYNDLDKRTVAQMVAEIAVANTFLQAIDGRTERTLTPPCGHSRVSDGDYVVAVKDDFVGVKFGPGNFPEGFMGYFFPNGHTGEELIAWVEQAAQQYSVLNLIFHGVGGDHLSVTAEAHETLLQYLVQNPDRYYTDTFINIARAANAKWQAAGGQ